MPNAASAAVTQATRLQEIGFAEFTATLINEVFEALVAANLRQMEAYVGLLQAATQSLKDFINETAGAVSPQDVATFLGRFQPLQVGQPVADAAALNDVLELPASVGEPVNNRAAPATGNLTTTTKQKIEDAVAKRIAANRFELLQETVRQGALRLIVDNGIIETRLTFSTYGRSDRSQSASERQVAANSSEAGGGAGIGVGGFGGVANILGGGGFQQVKTSASLNVSTAKSTERDVTGSSVQIYGRVQIQFKTDYAPLASR